MSLGTHNGGSIRVEGVWITENRFKMVENLEDPGWGQGVRDG